eukprot:3121600-Rhodomonas_salina.1
MALPNRRESVRSWLETGKVKPTDNSGSPAGPSGFGWKTAKSNQPTTQTARQVAHVLVDDDPRVDDRHSLPAGGRGVEGLLDDLARPEPAVQPGSQTRSQRIQDPTTDPGQDHKTHVVPGNATSDFLNVFPRKRHLKR